MIVMALGAGTHTLVPSNGTVLVHTGREGVAAKMGHDLTLEVTGWTATVTVDGTELERSSVTATLDAGSIEIKEAAGGAMPLSDKDRKDIKRNLAEKVLRTDRHPEITFESTAVEAADEGVVTVVGNLRILGVSQSVRFPLTVERADGTVRLTGKLPVVQSAWGIKPFSAMMGALKVPDRIEVSVDVRLPAA
jgi:polyisoprenoid-binding protein YceI